MFKALAVVGALMMVVGAGAGFGPINVGSVSCGSSLNRADDLRPGPAATECDARRHDREGIAIVLLIVGTAAALGGAMGLVSEGEEENSTKDGSSPTGS
ncbi:hypothetical protein [Kribbella sp. VKM Ac-2568]|uniref:hypothetical protein n=1 Tax=Kribbella sp. VKM Ac-2568 TaxID=2512219 RepID=UPI001053D4DD|nr:hypothetical protein [Kribbella sp. VKM Ac-2568]TCM47888.1 hypothetical protein EV648_104283 [Kribbella sp. VKM Ac-2568]